MALEKKKKDKNEKDIKETLRHQVRYRIEVIREIGRQGEGGRPVFLYKEALSDCLDVYVFTISSSNPPLPLKSAQTQVELARSFLLAEACWASVACW